MNCRASSFCGASTRRRTQLDVLHELDGGVVEGAALERVRAAAEERFAEYRDHRRVRRCELEGLARVGERG
jgi:hypothetical protein